MNSLLSIQFPLLWTSLMPDVIFKFFTVLNLCWCCIFVHHATYVIICDAAMQILSNIIVGTCYVAFSVSVETSRKY